MKQKILIILDHDYNTDKRYNMFIEQIKFCYGDNYDIVFKLFNDIQKQYNYVPENTAEPLIHQIGYRLFALCDKVQENFLL